MDQLLNFFIPKAFAQQVPTPSAQGGGGLSFILMFVFLILFMYFAIWRPQSKRAKEQQALLDSLAKGDEVVTTGGIIGRISKISGQYLGLNVANNVEVIIQKSYVSSVLPKGTIKSIE